SKLAGLLVPGLLIAAIYYAVFGGEYSVFELREARAALEVERVALIRVEEQIGSLAAWADSLENDPTTLERIAREDFGMIRDGETLYRFADAGPVAELNHTDER
ncbi:MAG: septum formation initiator family protein, partial [Gemmatimonadetes bacterium]|nr:septum formation initiator family protein [Gemmatimonadota bacterium]